MLSPFLSIALILAASAGPPPYPESLACAAVSQAAAELAKDPITGIPEGKTFDHAMFWSFATMDAARRDGIAAATAEADQVRERAAIKPMLAAGDAGAKSRLADCLARTPGAPS
jgi:hypothetical protein